MNYSSWPKWIGLLQAPGAAASPQRLKGRILTIVWVKPAQKGLKLCFTCKASHAQNSAQSKYLWSVPQDLQLAVVAWLAYTNGTAMVELYFFILRIRSASLRVHSLKKRTRSCHIYQPYMHDWLPSCAAELNSSAHRPSVYFV